MGQAVQLPGVSAMEWSTLKKLIYLRGRIGGSTPPTPPATAYVKLSAPSSFSLSASKGWNGTMEYSLDGNAWQTWSGSSISGTEIYLRGIGNTTVTNDSTSNKFTISGSNVKVAGSVAALLDFATVEQGEDPTPLAGAFRGLFYESPAVVDMAELICPNILSRDCLRAAFSCQNLVIAPAILPAQELAQGCYFNLFYGAALKRPPILPATRLAKECYRQMFYGCSQLEAAPALPALTLVSDCYWNMFINTPLKIQSAPTTGYDYEFRIPASGEGNIVVGASAPTSSMFYPNSGVATPQINTTYYANFPTISA